MIISGACVDFAAPGPLFKQWAKSEIVKENTEKFRNEIHRLQNRGVIGGGSEGESK